MIHMRDVSLKRQNKMILSAINWDVNKGEHWAILGLNGAGKTALLNIVTGYLFPTTGTVHILGHKFGYYPLIELRKRIGWVSSSLQERLYGENLVEEVVVSGKFASIGIYDKPTDEDKQRALDLIHQLGCKHLIKRSYHTLSQGEKQRILIARALMPAPDILILDEPCTGLDFIVKEQLLATIQELSQEPPSPTMIYVTHHIDEILPLFSHTLLLKEGQIYQAGASVDLLTTACLTNFFEHSVVVHSLPNGRSALLKTEKRIIVE